MISVGQTHLQVERLPTATVLLFGTHNIPAGLAIVSVLAGDMDAVVVVPSAGGTLVGVHLQATQQGKEGGCSKIRSDR
jgi:zinc transporter ZupT